MLGEPLVPTFLFQLMVLQLHVWGPAFGLPSVEPECIATIAYCQRVIPRGQWALISDFDPTVGSAGKMRYSVGLIESDIEIGSRPILFEDGVATANGFEDIVAYLRNHPAVQEDLDANITGQQQTDKTALVALYKSSPRSSI
tara:strand:+ start:8991 stop:9416 length:426 start_codon:yes stop_codon:yes gene_type:complete